MDHHPSVFPLWAAKSVGWLVFWVLLFLPAILAMLAAYTKSLEADSPYMFVGFAMLLAWPIGAVYGGFWVGIQRHTKEENHQVGLPISDGYVALRCFCTRLSLP